MILRHLAFLYFSSPKLAVNSSPVLCQSFSLDTAAEESFLKAMCLRNIQLRSKSQKWSQWKSGYQEAILKEGEREEKPEVC